MLLCEIIERREFELPKGFHPNDSLLIVLEGKFTCSIQDQIYNASKNDIFVFHSKTPFERKVIEPLKCIYVQFHVFPFEVDNGILNLADSSRAESTISLLEEATIEESKTKILQYINDLFFLYQSSTMLCQTHICSLVKHCITFLNENYESTITLDSLARHFFVSKQWLIRKFKEDIGKTPREYLNSIRMRQAQTLLKQTELSIGEIAMKCGFENIYYFSNVFVGCYD